MQEKLIQKYEIFDYTRNLLLLLLLFIIMDRVIL